MWQSPWPKRILFAGVGLIASYLIFTSSAMFFRKHKLRKIKKNKILSRDQAITAFLEDPQFSLIDNEFSRFDEITGMSPEALIEEMTTKKTITSRSVVKIFCHQAIKAHRQVNCLTEVLFKAAMDRARFMDTYLESEGKAFGLLHGLPVSVKDTLQVKGTGM
jgi:hypothetical protein